MSDTTTATWVPDIAGRSGPIYLRIVEALAQDHADGALHPGDRLPAQRALAERLGVDLTTVTRAFSEARRRNLIDAAAGRGSFVTARGPEEPILDLGMNIPPSPLGLNLPGLIRGGIDGLLKRSSAEALLSYHPGPGSPAERGAGVSWLEGSAGRRLPLDRVGVGAGAQALLTAVLLSTAREGDAVLVDTLTYPGFIGLARTLRLRLVSVGADAEGMRPDMLEAMAKETHARLVYLNPTLHNPTTRVVPETRRHDIAAVARRLNLAIIEDDPYAPLLADKAPASFLAIAPEATFHVATLAKCISPFLRTAFIAAPSAEALNRVAASLRSLTLMAAPLMTSLASEWVRSGVAEEIVGGVRAEVRARHEIAAAVLPGGARLNPDAFHAWLELGTRQQASVVFETARAQGLAVSPAADFSTGDKAPEAVRVALGAIGSRERLADALRRLATVLGTPGAATAAMV
ncbi:aminotransferase-like domain-containing protein [Aureimonas ureilytica]|uniref:aminotransferase-like domain-containing protein n=1 Tax=Aureimonas ureilytica TaxID=401562 RepID=UPI0003681558|nr:PLP-dependent aminotransferase family protein [Aureimonas ureilytica]